MAIRDHADAQTIHMGAHITSIDPGAVGALKLWVDTSVDPPLMYYRSADNSGWLGPIGATGGGGGGLTTEQVQDLVAAMMVDGANITVVYDDTAGTLTITASGEPHALVGASHTASGLTTGHVLTATGPTTFAFQAPAGGGATRWEAVTNGDPDFTEFVFDDGDAVYEEVPL